MPYRKMSPLILAAVLQASLFSLVCSAHAQNASASHLGKYAELSTYCGKQLAAVDVSTIPEFGCFVLSAGHSATGTFSGHLVEVSVDDKGEEAFKVDGTVIEDLSDPHKQPPNLTNLPFVHTSGSGYGICKDPNSFYCPSDITVFSRNPNKTVLFQVNECLPPNYKVCVSAKENW